MTVGGLQPRPAGTLIDRALEYLERAPAPSEGIARDILGLQRAPGLVADRLAAALLGADPRVRRLPDGQWALVRTTGPSPPIGDCAFAVVDVETTGSSPRRGDRVIEIGVAVLSGWGRGREERVEVVYDELVNPGRPVPAVVTGLTRITGELLQDRPKFSEVADEVLALLAGRVFTAHNVRFDWGFLAHELRRARDVVLTGSKICTVRLARRLIPGLKSRSLDSVARYFGIEIERRHRAGDDALATARVLSRLLELASERGAKTLSDLEGLGRSRARGRKRRKKRTAMPTPIQEI